GGRGERAGRVVGREARRPVQEVADLGPGGEHPFHPAAQRVVAGTRPGEVRPPVGGGQGGGGEEDGLGGGHVGHGRLHGDGGQPQSEKTARGLSRRWGIFFVPQFGEQPQAGELPPAGGRRRGDAEDGRR